MTDATSDLSLTETGSRETPLTLAEDMKGFALWLITGPFVLTAGIFRAMRPRRRPAKPAPPHDMPVFFLKAGLNTTLVSPAGLEPASASGPPSLRYGATASL